jgi:hypothetical protein
MNTFLTALLAATASASILPIKFNFGNSHPTLKAVKQCGKLLEYPKVFYHKFFRWARE